MTRDISRAQRFRPTQAHFYGDQKDKADEEMRTLRSTASRPSTRRSSLSQSELPFIKTSPGGSDKKEYGKYLSKTDYNAIDLPRLNKTTPKTGSVSLENLPTYKPGDWKKDRSLRDWAAGVTKRNQDQMSSKLRAANKEANWVMERRGIQTKQVQKRQKALLEAERKASMITQPKKPNTEGSTHSGSDKEEHITLKWRVIPEPQRQPSVLSKAAVWIKPGKMALVDIW